MEWRGWFVYIHVSVADDKADDANFIAHAHKWNKHWNSWSPPLYETIIMNINCNISRCVSTHFINLSE